jgi:hypothetical protein
VKALIATSAIQIAFRQSDPEQLAYFSAVNGITEQQARELIRKHGDNLAVLVKEARRLRELE